MNQPANHLPIQQVRWNDRIAIVDVAGDIDLSHSVDFQQQLLALLDQKPQRIVINLGQVPYMEYGLSFYRNREVVNYEEDGVPDGRHILVARIAGRGGTGLNTQAALEEYLEGRSYQQLFSWPEQGLMVYLVGSR